jgi:hypothetical protein
MKPAPAAAAEADLPEALPSPPFLRGFEQPDGPLDRLYELAARDQWTVSGLDWSAINFGALPLPIRLAAADLFAQLHHGELTAMRGAARMLDRLPSHDLRLVCATQVSDEARHARFFERLLASLECEARVRSSVRALMLEVDESDTLEGGMLGMQILIEGVAHSFFLEASRAFAGLSLDGALSGHLLTVRTVVCDWLPNLLARDESRHIALGLHYLRARLPELDRKARHALEESVQRWGEMILTMARGPVEIDAVGLDGLSVCQRCVADINLRLAQIGLASRIPAVALAEG